MITTIGKLFTIVYGQREYHNKEWLEETEEGNMLISSKGKDNGVYGFYDISTKFKAPFISVQGYGTIGHAFVQEYDCSVDDHMLILMPKQKMRLDELYQVAYQIRLTKWKFKYGRGITPDRLKPHKIVLNNFKRDWKSLIKTITPKNVIKIKIRRPTKKRNFKLKELFTITRGKGSYLEKMSEGSTPVVSTQTSDNGICGFFDIKPVFSKYCITVGRIMCNPYVQLYDFATVPDDMFVLISKNESSKEFMFYVSSIIKTEGWRFNYSRKVTKKRLGNINIILPMKNRSFNHKYISLASKNSYGYNELSK